MPVLGADVDVRRSLQVNLDRSVEFLERALVIVGKVTVDHGQQAVTLAGLLARHGAVVVILDVRIGDDDVQAAVVFLGELGAVLAQGAVALRDRGSGAARGDGRPGRKTAALADSAQDGIAMGRLH